MPCLRARGREPGEKAGFIVIRPGGNSAPRPPLDDSATADADRGYSERTPALNVPPPGPAPKDDDRNRFDYWFAVGVEGQRVGYVNWAAKETKQNDKCFIVGVRYLNLTVSRFGQVVEQWGEESTVETPTGEVSSPRCGRESARTRRSP